MLDQFKILREDTLMAQDLNETIDKYRDVLRQYEAPFPKKFVLQDMLDLYEQSNPRPQPKAVPASKPPEKATEKPAEKTPEKQPPKESRTTPSKEPRREVGEFERSTHVKEPRTK